jgi:RHS repeat-associated protein
VSLDSAGRLAGISYAKGTTAIGDVTYALDANGHRTHVGGALPRVTLPAAVASATYNADNQLTNWAGTTYSYDLNGNMTSDGTSTYSWNARGQLTTIAAGATTTASYGYDPLGRRVARTISGAATGFAYNGSTAVQEKSGSTVTANSIVGGTDQVFSRTDSAGTRSYLTDGLNSTLGLVDSAGVVQTSYAYTPYGATTPSGATSTNAVQYTGRENDGNGLYYYRARYYNPTLCRFISEDPLGLSAGLNVYAYASDDPVDFNDPSGMIVQVLVAGCIGGAVLSLVADVATAIGNWFNGFFGGPKMGQRKVTLTGMVVDAAIGCALGALTAGLGELWNILRAGGDVPKVPLAPIDAGDLSLEQAANYQRFLRSMPTGAGPVRITQLPDGLVQFESDVPGTVPGSYATYTKVVDANGSTVTFYKTTIAPDGTVVHVKVKFP